MPCVHYIYIYISHAKCQAVAVNAALKVALRKKKERRSCDVVATNLLCSLLTLALLAVLVVLIVTSS